MTTAAAVTTMEQNYVLGLSCREVWNIAAGVVEEDREVVDANRVE